jgi:hypothetical protein
MIFDRIATIFRGVDQAGPDRSVRARIGRVVSRRARRWSRAFAAQPELADDLLSMSRALTLSPRNKLDLLSASAEEMAYLAGRRDLALELLALMHVTKHEIHQMMQELNDENHRHDDRGPLA